MCVLEVTSGKIKCCKLGLTLHKLCELCPNDGGGGRGWGDVVGEGGGGLGWGKGGVLS